ARHDNRQAPCGLFHELPLRVGEAGGANHHRLGVREVRKCPFGAGEIDQDIGACCRFGLSTYFYASHLLAYGGAPRHVEGGRERQAGVGKHRLDEAAPHAAACARDRDLHRVSPPEGITSPSTRASWPFSNSTVTLRVSRCPLGGSRQ